MSHILIIYMTILLLITALVLGNQVDIHKNKISQLEVALSSYRVELIDTKSKLFEVEKLNKKLMDHRIADAVQDYINEPEKK